MKIVSAIRTEFRNEKKKRPIYLKNFGVFLSFKFILSEYSVPNVIKPYDMFLF